MRDVLLVLVFSVHLLLVNVAMAAPLVALALKVRQLRDNDAVAGALGLELSQLALSCLVWGSLLGGVLLGMIWLADSHPYLDGLAAVPGSRYWFGLLELLFYAGCMVVLIRLWKLSPARRFAIYLLAVLAATDLMFHFPPLFTIVAVAARRPDLAGHTIDRSTYYRLLLDAEVLSRVLHVWLASLAVTGMALCLLAARRRGRQQSSSAQESTEGAQRMVRWGARLALTASVAQIPVGLYVLYALPNSVWGTLMGDDLLATTMFGISILLNFHLINRLAAISLGDSGDSRLRSAAWSMSLIVLLMTGSLHRAQSLGASTRSVTTEVHPPLGSLFQGAPRDSRNR